MAQDAEGRQVKVRGLVHTSSINSIVQPVTTIHKWVKVQAGDFIRFQYQGDKPGSKRSYRTVFVLQPRYTYESPKTEKTTIMVAGIELFSGMTGRIKRVRQWINWFKGIGIFEEHPIIDGIVRIKVRTQYRQLKNQGENEALWKYVKLGVNKGFLRGAYKTYNFDYIKGNTVYWAQIPFWENVAFRANNVAMLGEESTGDRGGYGGRVV